MPTPHRAVAALLAALSVLIAAPAAHATPQPFAGNERYADALWLVHSGKAFYLYVAAGDAYVIADPQGPTAFENETEGIMVRFKCRVRRSHGWVGLSCGGHAPWTTIDQQDFVIDPTLNIATLTMQVGSATGTVNWTAEDLPYAEPIVARGIDGAAAGAFIYQPASASGTIFGQPLGRDYGELFEVTEAGALEPSQDANPNGDRFEITRDGIRVHRTFRFPIEETP